MTITLDDAEMTLLTGHPSRDILPMIEAPALDLNIPFGLDVTGGAPSDGT